MEKKVNILWASPSGKFILGAIVSDFWQVKALLNTDKPEKIKLSGKGLKNIRAYHSEESVIFVKYDRFFRNMQSITEKDCESIKKFIGGGL